jgi:hypothetical protein
MSNPNTDVVILNALGAILLPGTRLATLQASVSPTPTPFYVQEKFEMSKGMFPALHLSSGVQPYHKLSTNHWEGTLLAIVEYYDKWTSQPSQHDAIRANIAADLEIMKSNVSKDEGLIGSGHVQQSRSISRITLSPYKGEFDNETIPGQKLIYRTMELSISIPPYDEID